MRKKIVFIAIAAVLIIAASFLLFNYSPTGLIGLIGESKEGIIMEENFNSNEESIENGLSPSLSFTVVEPTELEVSFVDDIILPCPQYRELSFQIENSGKSNAERLFVEHSENLQVLECNGCSVREINAKQKVEVTIKACKTDEESAFISFSSINAEERRIEID